MNRLTQWYFLQEIKNEDKYISTERGTYGLIAFVNRGKRFVAFLQEIKNEEGSVVSDPVMQCLAYYSQAILNNTNYRWPCLIVILCGPTLRVLGIVNTKTNVICEWLVPTLKLAYVYRVLPGSVISNSV